MEDPALQQKLKSIDHIQTFVIHLFRSETARETAMRGRLDVTTGGAVVGTSGLVSLAFTSTNVGHLILLANILILFVFLLVEARRYRLYVSIKNRVRGIEKTYIAPLFNQIALEPQHIDYQPHIDSSLINSLLEQKPPIKYVEAILSRLQRVYIYLFGVTYIVWLNRILRGRTDQPWLDHINQQASVGIIPGAVVFFMFSALMLSVIILSLYVAHTDDRS